MGVSPMPGGPVLELRAVDKRFTGTYALKKVDLAFKEGEIHALVGENGAGKSTMIKILTGAYVRSGGTILWRGQEVALDTPQAALALGINAVHQEVVLCPHLRVAANMFLGDESTRTGLLRDRLMQRRAQTVLDELGFRIDAGMLLGDLTIGQQQLVATARAAMRGARFLIFDEPTAYLTREETDQLFRLIRRLHQDGVTIVYISHRLEEIFELAERVSVLRDGALVATRLVAETSTAELIRDMVARSLAEIHYKEEVPKRDLLLEVEGLSGPGFKDVSLTVHRGQVVGLYGLIGAGRSEFVQCLFGRTRRTAGKATLKGLPFHARTPAEAIALGVALVPESRRDQGLCLNLGVGFNLNLTIFHRLSRLGIVRRAAERAAAAERMSDMHIVAAGQGARAATLSGGNQQKIVIGKWLSHGADLYIFDEPTVGVDVGTKLEIYKIFARLLREGAGIILISSYLPEVQDLADELLVFNRGRLKSRHPARAVGPETVLKEAIGV
ncbi:monosaccharide ABC transporter ATP-binding protein, CUT2 family [Arboricoccus pini]|uniref:Monosaccharide ABC transporter ATP-binding protein, CUT2 family n=1 Tax=Arboricoccus pini TaxID=1963835 RepID=A0A212RZJ3_9PROT|nr:sugar ABC transporter ATP-binding protein [Arboricoccus pini]SNB78233.1 monosaccharide ABC transporter ATP-binding protein, CUT2 family [Arboricoccus pini]